MSPAQASASSSTSGGAQNVLADKVIGSAQGYTKIVAEPFGLGVVATGSDAEANLSIDLSKGSLQITLGSTSVSCALDSSRLQALQGLMSNSEICQPAPPAPGTVECMAMAAPDIELSNSQSSVSLSVVVCNNGTFLCDGNDAILRQVLASLRSSPPTGCN